MNKKFAVDNSYRAHLFSIGINICVTQIFKIISDGVRKGADPFTLNWVVRIQPLNDFDQLGTGP